MKITAAKKILLALGIGIGMATTSVSYSINCNALLYACEYEGSYQACVNYTRYCGAIP